MLLVLILNLIIDHCINFAALKVELKFKIVLLSNKLNSLSSLFQTKFDQRIMFIGKRVDFVCGLITI